MTHRPLRRLVVSVVGLILLVPTPPAHAGAATLAFSPSVGPPTSKIQATGSGFGAQEVIDLAFDGTVIAHATTDPDGSFSTKVRIPRSALPGDHTVNATGESSGSVASAAFLVRTNWPQFHRDPSRSGDNPYENVLSPSNVATLELKWSYQGSDSANGSPAVVDGVVYFGDFAGKIYAVEAATGIALWSRTVGDSGGSPAVVDGIVYTATGLSGGVVALDVQTGDILWQQYTGGGTFGSPAAAYGMVYEGSNDRHLRAFDAKTGGLRWGAHLADGAGSSTPAVANGLVYVGGYSLDFYAFDALTGEKVWAAPVRSYTAGAAVSNGVVYVGTNNAPPYHLYALDAATGAPIWSRTVDDSEGGHGVEGTPTIANGLVYVGTVGGTLYAFDASSGALRWTFEPGGAIFTSTPVVANGVLYTGSSANTFYALDARTGIQLWSYEFGFGTNGAPAVADGIVYMQSFDRNLYAFALPG